MRGFSDRLLTELAVDDAEVESFDGANDDVTDLLNTLEDGLADGLDCCLLGAPVFGFDCNM